MSLRKHGSFTWEDGATSLETLEAEGKGTEGEDRLESFKNNINFEIQFSSSKKTRQDNPYFLYRLVETISPNSSFFFFFNQNTELPSRSSCVDFTHQLHLRTHENE